MDKTLTSILQIMKYLIPCFLAVTVLAFCPDDELVSNVVASVDMIHNSTYVCTSGPELTNHSLNCNGTGFMYITRVFHGTPPLSSECHKQTSNKNCCFQDDPTECIFENESDLVSSIVKCSGRLNCTIPASRVATPTDKTECNSTVYPKKSDFSFVEMSCVSQEDRANICGQNETEFIGRAYMDSNNVIMNRELLDVDCGCFIHTRCDSNLIFEASELQIEGCAEELYFVDTKFPKDVYANLTCAGGQVLYGNKLLFTSKSNSVYFRMNITGNHTGKVLIRVRSSCQAAYINITCGLLGGNMHTMYNKSIACKKEKIRKTRLPIAALSSRTFKKLSPPDSKDHVISFAEEFITQPSIEIDGRTDTAHTRSDPQEESAISNTSTGPTDKSTDRGSDERNKKEDDKILNFQTKIKSPASQTGGQSPSTGIIETVAGVVTTAVVALAGVVTACVRKKSKSKKTKAADSEEPPPETPTDIVKPSPKGEGPSSSGGGGASGHVTKQVKHSVHGTEKSEVKITHKSHDSSGSKSGEAPGGDVPKAEKDSVHGQEKHKDKIKDKSHEKSGSKSGEAPGGGEPKAEKDSVHGKEKRKDKIKDKSQDKSGSKSGSDHPDHGTGKRKKMK